MSRKIFKIFTPHPCYAQTSNNVNHCLHFVAYPATPVEFYLKTEEKAEAVLSSLLLLGFYGENAKIKVQELEKTLARSIRKVSLSTLTTDARTQRS